MPSPSSHPLWPKFQNVWADKYPGRDLPYDDNKHLWSVEWEWFLAGVEAAGDFVSKGLKDAMFKDVFPPEYGGEG